MANTLVRVSGVVIDVPAPRRGTTVRDGNAVPWEIATVNVLVANRNVTVVQLPRKDDYNELPFENAKTGFKVGDAFDALVEVGIYRNSPQFVAVGDFPTSQVLDFATGALTDA